MSYTLMDMRRYLDAHSVGIIGYGHFGKFLDDKMPPTKKVLVHDPKYTPDGERFFTFEEAARCDVVILAAPISAFEQVLRRVLACDGSGVLINVCTVQAHPVRLLQELAKDRVHMSFHAMFGAEGVAKRNGNMSGLRLVATEQSHTDEAFESVLGFFQAGLGLEVVRMTADDHDVLLAESLFLAQYIGRAMSFANFVRSRIGTVSFDLLMDMVDIVRHDAALFRDVVKFNPHCAVVRRRFHEGLAKADEEYEAALRAA